MIPAARPARWPALGLALLLLLLTLLHARLVARDSLPPVGDGAELYRAALEWRRAIVARGVVAVMNGVEGEGARPPLPRLALTAAFLLAGEGSLRVARLAMLPFLWLLLLATYALGTRLRDGPTGLFAAALLASSPQVMGLSREPGLALPATACVALALWALLASEGFRRLGWSLCFGLALAAVLLCGPVGLLCLPGPLALLLALALAESRRLALPDRRRERRGIWRNLALALCLAALLAGPWLLARSVELGAALGRALGAGETPARAWWTLENLLRYPAALRREQTGTLLFVLLLLGLAGCYWRAEGRARRLLLLWAAVPYLALTYLVLGAGDARLTLPALPALCLMAAWGLLALSRAPLARLAAIGAGLVALWLPVMTSLSPASGVAGERFPWSGRAVRGLRQARPLEARLTPALLFPDRPAGRPLTVGMIPELDGLAAVLGTWAAEEGEPVRFRAVRSDEDPAALPYLLRLLPPRAVLVREGGAAFAGSPAWRAGLRRFALRREIPFVSGFRVQVLGRR